MFIGSFVKIWLKSLNEGHTGKKKKCLATSKAYFSLFKKKYRERNAPSFCDIYVYVYVHIDCIVYIAYILLRH